jgi:hypothetical protein
VSDINDETWNRFIREAIVEGSETNVSHPFKTLTKKYGLAYIEYLRAAWSAADDMTAEEFCRINGGVPQGFFDKKVR